jgi:riboflavin transporter FmnP
MPAGSEEGREVGMLIRILWIVLIASIGAVVNSLIKEKNPDHNYITGYIVGTILMVGLQIIEGVCKR